MRLTPWLLVAVCGLVACGGSSSTKTGSGGPQITLMVASDLSSPASIPEVPLGARAAVDALNARGGIGGRRLRLVVCDDGQPAPTACARRAVTEHVAAVVGSQSAGINPILLSHGIAQIGNAPFVPDDFTATNSFPLFGFITSAGAVIKALAATGCHRIAPLVLSGESSGASANRYVHLAEQTTPGITVLPEIPVPFQATDLSAQLAKAAAGGSDCIAGIVFAADAAKLLQEAATLHVHQRIGFGQSSLPQVLVTQLGPAAEGVVEGGGFRALSSPNPQVKRFKAEMARYERDARLSNLSLNSWAAVQLFRIAANVVRRHHRPIDAGTILAAMRTLSHVDLGVSAPVDFTHPGTLPGAPRVVNTQVFFSRVRRGVITDVSEQPHSLLGAP